MGRGRWYLVKYMLNLKCHENLLVEGSSNKLDVWNQNSETRVLGTALTVSSYPFQKTGPQRERAQSHVLKLSDEHEQMTTLVFVRLKNTNRFLHLRLIVENGLHPYRSVCHIFKACQFPVSSLWTSYHLNRQYHTQDGWREFSHQLAEVAPRAPSGGNVVEVEIYLDWERGTGLWAERTESGTKPNHWTRSSRVAKDQCK